MNDRQRAFAGDNVGRQLKRRRKAEAAVPSEPFRRRRVQQSQIGAPSDFDPEAWFASNGWRPFDYQREAWRAIAAGESGLIHASTGSGKTFAVWLGMLAQAARQPSPLQVLWITPMRALAADTARALWRPVDECGLAWDIGVRTGDTDASERARQSARWPEVLVTTPESLSLLLARSDATALLSAVRYAVVDEWHELLGSKRGVQVQLALARIRTLAAGLQTWGLSATLGNLQQAADVLFGTGGRGRCIRGAEPKTVQVDTLVPEVIERFPWGGHLGLRQLPGVIREIESCASTLVFCNVRSAAELWYRAILEAKPEWAGVLALHHGSLDAREREFVELGLKEGSLKAVICTSSLDLGVDFLPVERVLQIGSAKGVARLLQRAGRSGHAPGRASRITLVPTIAFARWGAAAVRLGVAAGTLEDRKTPRRPLDVLIQHVVTRALGGGFDEQELLAEVRSTHAYADLSQQEWQWTLEFAAHGGTALRAYPDYHRITRDDDGVWRIASTALARRHRVSIGTIVADAMMRVQYLGGKRIGTIEEAFIAMLRPGERFLFGGRTLELRRVHEMTAYVKAAPGGTSAVPRWNGSRMAFSDLLAHAMLAVLRDAEQGIYSHPELEAVRPLLRLQQERSSLPIPGRLVMEELKTREGYHFFCYPFAGRLAHVGLSALLAFRISRRAPATFSLSSNDYGFEMLCTRPVDWEAELAAGLFTPERVLDDVIDSFNASQLAARRFREIARVAGLLFPGYPGQPKSARQLQASSGLFFDVFTKHDPDNLLLAQAQREALEQELEITRLTAALTAMAAQNHVRTVLRKPTPFAFPLLVGRMREKLSSEKLADRVARMLAQLEADAGTP